MNTAHINIGSNLGNRADNISRAVALLAATAGDITAQSSLHSSQPHGFDSANEFINCGINILTPLSPHDLMAKLKEIEHTIAPGESHRTPQGQYADRTIDLDIIAIGSVAISDDTLQVPHPRMHTRRFVLRPLAQIWPQWRHPLSHLTAEEMLQSAQ